MENRFYGLNAVQVFREAVDAVQVENNIKAGRTIDRTAIWSQMTGALIALAYVCDKEEYDAVCEEKHKFVDMLNSVKYPFVQD